MTRAAYAGSFDPPTNGHLHVIKTAARLFGELHIIVAINADKKEASLNRVGLLETIVRHEGLTNVRVTSSIGEFVARRAAELWCHFMVRGVRGAADLEAERTIARINSLAAPQVETVVIMAPAHLQDVSSSTVRGLVGLLGWQAIVRPLVPRATMLTLEIQRAYELASSGCTKLLSSPRPVLDRYIAPGRAYHSIGHIVYCQEWVRRLATSVRPTDADMAAVSQALWFHDAVYDAKATDNEEKSAALITNLGYMDVQPVREIIRATARHLDADFNPPDMATQLVLDIDLAGFAEPEAEVAQAARGIRAEYAHVPEDVYWRGRAGVLRRLLDKPSIYRTAFFRDLEQRARINIARELAELEERLGRGC